MGQIFLGGKGASESDGRAEEAEKAFADVDAAELFRVLAGEGEAGADVVIGGDFFEDAGLAFVGVEVGDVGKKVGDDSGARAELNMRSASG